MPKKWLQERAKGSKNEPPRSAFGGTFKKKESCLRNILWMARRWVTTLVTTLPTIIDGHEDLPTIIDGSKKDHEVREVVRKCAFTTPPRIDIARWSRGSRQPHPPLERTPQTHLPSDCVCPRDIPLGGSVHQQSEDAVARPFYRPLTSLRSRGTTRDVLHAPAHRRAPEPESHSEHMPPSRRDHAPGVCRAPKFPDSPSCALAPVAAAGVCAPRQEDAPPSAPALLRAAQH